MKRSLYGSAPRDECSETLDDERLLDKLMNGGELSNPLDERRLSKLLRKPIVSLTATALFNRSGMYCRTGSEATQGTENCCYCWEPLKFGEHRILWKFVFNVGGQPAQLHIKCAMTLSLRMGMATVEADIEQPLFGFSEIKLKRTRFLVGQALAKLDKEAEQGDDGGTH